MISLLRETVMTTGVSQSAEPSKALALRRNSTDHALWLGQCLGVGVSVS